MIKFFMKLRRQYQEAGGGVGYKSKESDLF